ncbi:MAG: HEAT repeat domain-containing protein [Isosphaeraceae bacterium]
MSADAGQSKQIGQIWVVLTALAVAAIAVWVFLVPALQARKPMGLSAPKPIWPVISRIDHGDSTEKTVAIRELYGVRLGPGEFAQVFPCLIQAMKDEAEMVRFAAAEVVGDRVGLIDPKSCPAAATALAALLDDSSPTLRARAAKSLGFVAHRGKLDAPPARLVACLDDDDEQVRIDASEALVEYGQDPELLVPVALRRIPTESPHARNAFTDVFWHVRLETSVLPALIAGLSSENSEIRHGCAGAINHMGQEARSALAAILNLLRKEIDTPRGDESRLNARLDHRQRGRGDW